MKKGSIFTEAQSAKVWNPKGQKMCILTFTEPIKAGTWFNDPGGMQGWVDIVGWLHTKGNEPPV